MQHCKLDCVCLCIRAPAHIRAGPWAGEGQCDRVPPLCRPLQVQLSETRRELQELKASLRVAQKEKEQLLMEKQARPVLLLSCPSPLSPSL